MESGGSGGGGELKREAREMKSAAKSTQNVWDLFAKDDNKICTRRKLRRRGLGLGGDSMIRRMAGGTTER